MRFGKEMYKHTLIILEPADEHLYAWKRTSYHWPLYGLDLSDRVLMNVYRENAIKIIGNKKSSVR